MGGLDIFEYEGKVGPNGGNWAGWAEDNSRETLTTGSAMAFFNAESRSYKGGSRNLGHWKAQEALWMPLILY